MALQTTKLWAVVAREKGKIHLVFGQATKQYHFFDTEEGAIKAIGSGRVRAPNNSELLVREIAVAHDSED